jgi:hypothetical protein
MQPTLKKILARFKGDRHAARHYCEDIARAAKNPYLKHEYNLLAIMTRLEYDTFYETTETATRN